MGTRDERARRRCGRRWPGAVALLVAGCAAPGPAEAPPPSPSPPAPVEQGPALTGELAPGGRRIVVALDRSGSMVANDPDRMAAGATELLVSLARPEDAIGVIRYGDAAAVAVPLSSVGDAEERARYAELRGGEREGETNYVAPLELAEAMLDRADAPAGSLLIFVSDGFANIGGGPYEVLARAERFARRGWKVATVALGRLVDRALLARVAAATRAGHYVARSPAELFAVFAQLASEQLGYVVADGALSPVTLPRGARRLVRVAALGGALGETTRDGSPAPGADRREHPLFMAAVHVAPEPGRYEVEGSDDAHYVATLVDLGLRAGFAAGKPPAEVTTSSFPVQLDVTGPDGAPLDEAALARCVARIAIQRASDGGVLLAGRLKRRSDAAAFAGVVTIPGASTLVPGEALDVVGRVSVGTLDGALSCRATSIVPGGLAAAAAASPPEGAAPAGSPEARLRDAVLAALVASAGPLELTGTHGWAEARVHLESGAGLPAAEVELVPGPLQGPDGEVAFAPRVDLELARGDWDGTVSEGAAADVRYRVFLRSDAAPGTYQGALELRVTVAGAAPATAEVPVTVRVAP